MSLRDKLGVVTYHGRDALQVLLDHGFKHFRIDAGWNIVEDKEGQFNWDWLDAAVQFLQDNKCSPFLSLSSFPCWLDPEGKIERVSNISPNECAIKFLEARHIHKWYAYLEKVISRYNISHFGCTTETNLPKGWWIGTEQEFANNVLRPARDVARQYGRYIVSPGTTIQPESRLNFLRAIESFQELRKVARDHSRKYVDQWDFHCYFDSKPEQMVNAIKLWLKQFKRYSEDPKQIKSGFYSKNFWEWWPKKKIFLSETGFDMRGVGSFPVGEEGQKLKFEPLLQWLSSDDIYAKWLEVVYIYRAWSPLPGSALIRPDMTPKPALKLISTYLQ